MTPGRQRLGTIHLAILASLWFALSMASAAAGRLADATSPYLVMHADDAIDWRPWDEAALAEARRVNKPIFLSIGYASCHWCHVMARKTFADPRVVGTLNRHFVNILVDREERPDLDHHFMAIMSAMLGFSGSPANFFLTPDGTPLFAAGYLGPDAEYGKQGFVALVETMARQWTENRAAILADAEDIRRQMREMSEPVPGDQGAGGTDPRVTAAVAWSKRFDKTYGGFGGGPKFLRPNVLSFLLHQGVRHGDRAMLDNVYRTLDHMAAGGVRDQLGGAFHRYAVDRFWQIPHFEIMLDENALLARLYLEAYQASRKPRYAAVARAVLDDLLERFQLPGGGFAAALDSESQHQDGHFYTWTAEELRSALGAELAPPFMAAYVDTAHGLVRGRSVLRLLDAPEYLLRTQRRLGDARVRLMASRARRVAPRRDDKLLTSWNALAVSAFAKAAQVLGDDRYLRVAQREIGNLIGAGTPLVHSRRAGRTSGAVFLDDYAFLIQALIDVYETDFEVRRLDDARKLMQALIGRFQDEPGSPFWFVPLGRATGVPAKVVLDEDNVPSGNAAALIALQRLVLFGAEAPFAEQARAILAGLRGHLDASAPLATGLLRALDFQPHVAREIVIVGDAGEALTQRLLAEVHRLPLIGTVLAVVSPDAARDNALWPLLAGRPLLGDSPTAYVCKNRICDLPIDTPSALAAQLDKLVKPGRTP